MLWAFDQRMSRLRILDLAIASRVNFIFSIPLIPAHELTYCRKYLPS
jgi:hypothetical protein